MISRILVLILVSASLGGCIFFSTRADQALRRTPNFKDGYADGCASAQEQGADYRGNPVRDETLYNTDKVYRAGWASGYQTCRPLDRRQNATPGDSPIGPPDPNH